MWAKIDDQFWSNPKIVQAGNEGAGVFVRLIAYSAAHLTDGLVPESVALFITGGDIGILQRLVGLDLLDKLDDGGYLVRSYLRCNPSKAEAEATSEERQRAGRKGAASRWNGKSYGKSHGKPDGESHGKGTGRDGTGPDGSGREGSSVAREDEWTIDSDDLPPLKKPLLSIARDPARG